MKQGGRWKMRKMNEFYANMINVMKKWKNEEEGSQTLEWLGIAAVIVIIVGAVSTAFGGEGSGIGDTIKGAFEGFIETIAGD